jgi:HEAT repeat protein
MVIVPEAASHASSAFAIPAETLFKVWPEANRQITNELTVYLELLAHRFSRVPEYFPSHLNIDQIHQAIRVNQCPPRRRWQEQAQSRELTPWTGNCAEAEPLSRWQALEVDPQSWVKPGAAEWTKVRLTLKRAVLLGVPGSGKSWLLQDEARRVAREQLALLQARAHAPGALVVPIYLRLGAVAEEPLSGDADICEALIHLLQRDYPLSEQLASWLRQQLLGPRCLLLLDALDEVTQERQGTLRAALQWLAAHSRCRMLLTSRCAGYQEAPFPLRGNSYEGEFELLALDGKKVTDFIEHWFAPNQEQGEHLLAGLRRVPALRAAARLPFLLAWLCLIASTSQEIPTSRVHLYEALLRFLSSRGETGQYPAQLKRHPDFQAYLLAASLAGQPLAEWLQQVQQHCWFDPDWNEVLVFLAGCLPDPNPLLEALLHEPHDVFHTMLLLAGRCLVETRRTLVKDALVDSIIQGLLTLLHSLSMRDRKQAALVLAQIGTPAVEGLLIHLQDSNEHWEVREAAAEALGKMGAAQAVGALLLVLRDKNMHWRTRCMAAWAVGQIGERGAVEPLLAVLRNEFEPWQVRCAALKALGQLGDPQVIDDLLIILRNNREDVFVSLEAVKVMREIGEPEVFLSALHHKEWFVRRDTASLLGELGVAQAIPELLTKLQDRHEHREVRWAATRSLGQLGDVGVGELLLARLRDVNEHWEVRSGAAQVLGELGDARAVETLVMMLRDKKREVRRQAAESLGKLSDPRAVPGLLEVVQRRDLHWEIRREAAEALGQIGDSRAVTGLLAVLQDEATNSMVRPVVVLALGQIGEAQAVDALLVELQSASDSLRQVAAQALGHLGDIRAVEALLGKLQNEGEFEHVRSAVVQALGELGDARAMRALLGTLQQKGRRPRPEIAVQLDDQWTMETWRRALRENESMRWAAAKVMLMLQTNDQQAVEDMLTTQWNLAEDQRMQRAEARERTAARALAGLIPAYDPRSFCEQLLNFWSQHALDRTAQVLLYELLERVAAQLRAEVGEAWPVWRTRLMPLTDQVLDLGLKRS